MLEMGGLDEWRGHYGGFRPESSRDGRRVVDHDLTMQYIGMTANALEPGEEAGYWHMHARIEEVYVFLDGRREDLIISGGVNVYPAEVERVLGEVPGVEDLAVFGVDDDRWGQRVCAAVVGAVDEAALASYAREHLAPAKRPKDYHRLDALPRTPTGKVRRLDLPDLLSVED